MKRLLLIFITIILYTNVWSQTDTEFWFVAPEVSADHGDAPVLLRITTATLPSDIQITMPANTALFPTLNYSIAANSTLTIDLTALGLQAVIEHFYDFLGGFPGKSNKGIYIEATNPVTAYYEVSRQNNCDIFALKGKNALGTEFYGVFQNYGYNMSRTTWTAPAYSALEIVAVEDGTIVTFEATQGQVFFGYAGPGPHTVPLDKGQSLSLVPDWSTNVTTGGWPGCATGKYANDFFGRAGPDHLGGVRVTSNNNITITKKDDSVRYRCVGGVWRGGCYDLIGDQLVPVDILGLEYIAMRGGLYNIGHPSNNTAPENLYIVATENNTDIFIDGVGPVANIDEGETYMYEFWATGNPFVHVRADKKVSVLHISGFGCEVGGAILPPTDKCTGSTQVAITRSSSEAFFINLMVWFGAEDEFYVNGVLQDGGGGTLFGPGDFTPLPSSPNWLVWRSPNLGTGTIPVNVQTLFQNTEDVFHLGVINGAATTGCRFGYFSDFNELKVNAEATGSGSGEIRACSYEQIQLYASGGTTFDWWPANYLNNPSIAQPIADPPAGTTTIFYVEVSGACGLTDTANVTVTKFPHVEGMFSVDLGNGCSPLEIEFHETSTQINERYWDYNFSGIGVFQDRDTILFGNNNNYDTDTTFTHTFINTSNEPTDSIETYEVRLLVKNSNDCVDTAYASLIVYPEVTADFTLTDLNDTIGCSPHFVQYVDNSNNEDVYYWKFGDGVSATNQNPTHTFTNILDSDTIYDTELIVRSQYFCRDTINMDIVINPYLEAGFTIDVYEGCSPIDVTFTNNCVFEDSVVLVYGDGDTLKAPTFGPIVHTYENIGTSVDTNTVELLVYNDEGCIKIWYDTIIVFPEIRANYNIDGNNYTGCNSRNVTFTNTSNYGTHIASEFLWSFGDGTNSNSVAVNIPHTYNNTSSADKIYNFNLHAESQYGCTDDTANSITIYRAYADFTIDNDEGCSPLPVNISNISIGNQITVWDWDFGDATTSALKDPPLKTYNNTTGATQVRNMQLTVTGTNGCSTFNTVPITVYSSVDLSFVPLNQIGCDSLDISFNSTILPNIAGTTYNWNFGDGTSSSLADPSHVYRNLTNAADVVYTADVTATTPNGCTDAESTTVTVRPYVNAKFSVDKVAECSPLIVDPVATSYVGIAQYRWDFGDGSPIVTGQNPAAHTYPANVTGADITYTLELEVLDPSGLCTDAITKTITVYSEATADFDPKNSTDCNPYTVTFDNLSFNAASYLWDFDDLTTSSQFEPVHTFTNNTDALVTYNVELEVTSNRGCTDTYTSQVNVNRFVEADFSIDISQGCSPVTVHVTNNSRGGTYYWFWDDDDLTLATRDRQSTNSTEEFDVIYTNILTGTTDIHNLTLIARNSATGNCYDTLKIPITVYPTIDAQFTYNPALGEGCNPLNVVFTNTTANASTYDWYFGDGSSTTETSPTHLFTNTTTSDKVFNVKMVAESVNGCIDSITYPMTVYSKVISGFSIANSEGCPPFNTTIDNTSIGNAANTYQWLIDNVPVVGSPTDLSDFNHTYNNTLTSIRNYEVKLIAENPHGCTSEHADIVSVYEYVEASYSMDIDEGCTPLNITFTDLSSIPASTTYTWDFDDGATSGLSNPTHTFYNPSRTADRTYTIDLTVQSPNYCSDDTSQVINVYHQPLSKFFIDKTSSCPPLVSNLVKESEGEDMFEWRFGDGTTNTTDASLTYTYPNTLIDVVQSYTLELWVGTVNNCKDSTSLDLSVFPDVITDFTYDEEGCSPLVSSFNNTSTSPAQYFFWNFDDGNTSNQEDPIHEFTNTWNADRIYNVYMKASSEYNCWDTITKPVTVYVQPIAEFNVEPIVQKFPENKVFIDNRSNPGPFNYSWDFGDYESSTSEEPNVHEYEHWGEYDIKLTINSQTSDCNDDITKSITVLPPDINADFTTNIDGGCLNDGLYVEFTAAASAFSEVYTYAWDFGDGTTGTGSNVSHTYENAGSYYVKMTASGEGGEDFEYKTIRAYSNPKANFEVSPTLAMLNIDLEARVEFYNLSECNDTEGCAYEWDFGDGGTAISRDVTHNYTEIGVYDIALFVTTANGCRDSLTLYEEVEIIGAGKIAFPNAFTPNGDGLNDDFRPVSEGVIKYELLVYNRWGELIFTTKDLSDGWDGKINSDFAKPDVYVWKAQGNFTNGRAFEIAGDVTLIR